MLKMLNWKKLCIGDGRILWKLLIRRSVGLFFTIDETDTGHYLWDQFESWSRRQCFWASRLSLNTIVRSRSVNRNPWFDGFAAGSAN